MKALLTIGGNTYLLENQKDCDALLHLLRGARRTRSETIFGPEGSDKYNDTYYKYFEVVDERSERVAVELRDDSEVISRTDFEKAKAENDRRIQAVAAGSEEPAEVSSRS